MIQPPTLQIRSLRHLYRYDLQMPENMIRQILSFPREKLIEDLQTVLRDAIDNFEKHEKEAQKLAYWTQLHAPVHALYFLGELGAVEALPVVEEFMAQDFKRLDFWLHGDILTEMTWEPLMKIAQSDFTLLYAFVYREETYVFARSMFIAAIKQHLYHHPEDKEKAKPHYRALLRHYIDKLAPVEDWVDDKYISTDLIYDLMDLQFNDLEDLLQEAIDKGCCDTGEIPNLEFAKKWADTKGEKEKKELMNIYQRYQHVVDTWYKDEFL